MNRRVDSEMEDELRLEYDFAQLEGGVRGKYVERYHKGTNLVLLDPDVAQSFPTEDDVILIAGKSVPMRIYESTEY